jgi:hypothetical protein
MANDINTESVCVRKLPKTLEPSLLDAEFYHAPLQTELGSFPDVPRRTHRKDTLIATGE